MLSISQLKSLLRIQSPDERDEVQEKTAVLDLSHQELRKFQQLNLPQLSLQTPIYHINASYNYLKDFASLNIQQGEAKQKIRIQRMDLSFNLIQRIDVVGETTTLLNDLQYLNLTANRIQSVDLTAQSMPVLQTLMLNSNRIKFFIDCPQSVKVLSLDDNQLAALAFTGGDSLAVLSARNNLVKNIGLDVQCLMLMDLQKNLVQDLQVVKSVITKNKQLLSVSFRDNPVSKYNKYKVTILQFGDQITQMDDVFISPHIRQGFKVLKAEQRLDQLIESANKKYSARLDQKQRIKNELMKQIENQQKQVQRRFEEGLKNEKQQLELLQNHAKQIVGRKIMNIRAQEQQFGKYVQQYSQAQSNGSASLIKQNQASIIQQRHNEDYLEYLRKNKPKEVSKNKSGLANEQSAENINQELPFGGRRQLQEQKAVLKGIQMFDTRCIESLLTQYQVQV